MNVPTTEEAARPEPSREGLVEAPGLIVLGSGDASTCADGTCR
ncbi:hypothetical protein [Sphaerisporangium flaviroseum]